MRTCSTSTSASRTSRWDIARTPSVIHRRRFPVPTWAIRRSSASSMADQEVFHSHHPHGGTIRWPRSPRAIDDMNLWTTAGNGPVKYPVIPCQDGPRRRRSHRAVRSLGPRDRVRLRLVPAVGRRLPVSIAMAHHYVAGMWGYWRVYNTLQQGDMRNDVMPDLRDCPIERAASGPDHLGQVSPGRPWIGSASPSKIVEKGKRAMEVQSAIDLDQGLG